MEKYYIGVDIGGTKTAVMLVNDKAMLLHREQFPTDVGPGAWHYTVDRITAIIDHCLPMQPVRAIGISCGGPLHSKRGMILSPPNLPGWDDVPICRLLYSKYHLPVLMQNDANAGAVAEWQYGAGMGYRNVIFLTFGTGMGAGLVLDNRLYSGTNDLGGEVGHMRLADDGPVGFHKRGSFEGFCSGTGLAQLMAVELLVLAEEIGRQPMLEKYKEPGQVTGQDVVAWALSGDTLALKVVEKSGAMLGKGLSILIDLFNPEVIVIGSMGVRLNELIFAPARKVIEQEAIPSAAAVCKIVPAALGERIGDYAALCVAQMAENTQNSIFTAYE